MTELGGLQDQNTTFSKIQSCVICFDPCKPARECEGTNLASAPEDLDMDLAVIVDSSLNMQADEYEGVKALLGSVLDQIVVSSQPNRANRHARVAVNQHSSSVPVPPTAYSDAADEEEMEEGTAEENKYQQDSGHGVPAVKSLTDRPKNLCHLNSDRGTVCGGYVQRWYYNEAVGACLSFWYGGCDGNSNRFNSEKECIQTCGKRNP